MLQIVLIVVIPVVALLNIILFFKIWGMTSNTKKILLFLEAQRSDLEYQVDNVAATAHYGERVQNKKD